MLYLPLRYSNIDVVYVPTGVKKNRTRILKPQSVLETMHPRDILSLCQVLLMHNLIKILLFLKMNFGEMRKWSSPCYALS